MLIYSVVIVFTEGLYLLMGRLHGIESNES